MWILELNVTASHEHQTGTIAADESKDLGLAVSSALTLSVFIAHGTRLYALCSGLSHTFALQ